MLSRLESGKRPTTSIEIVRYATLCDVSSDEQDALLRLASEPDDYRLVPHNGKVPDEVGSVIFNESTASTIEGLYLSCVPAIVQTADYARAMFESAHSADPKRVDNWVAARMARQGVLARAVPARCALFVHEQALRLPVASARVMHEQMLNLVLANGQRHCDIRIVPASAGVAGVARNSFSLFTYPDGAPLIHVETPTTSEFMENRQDIAAYRDILDRIARVALTEVGSTNLMMELASDRERAAGGVA